MGKGLGDEITGEERTGGQGTVSKRVLECGCREKETQGTQGGKGSRRGDRGRCDGRYRRSVRGWDFGEIGSGPTGISEGQGSRGTGFEYLKVGESPEEIW